MMRYNPCTLFVNAQTTLSRLLVALHDGLAYLREASIRNHLLTRCSQSATLGTQVLKTVVFQET